MAHGDLNERTKKELEIIELPPDQDPLVGQISLDELLTELRF